jgi:GNAT superfamily N-acetyltransferase
MDETSSKPPAGLLMRPYDPTSGDDEGRVALHNAIWPDEPTSLAEHLHREQSRDARYFRDIWIMEMDGRVVGVGEYEQDQQFFHPLKYQFYVEVHPDYRGRGIGNAFWEKVNHLLRHRPVNALVAYTRDDQPEGIRFLEKRGFTCRLQEKASRLVLAEFDPARFQDTISQVEASGITFKALPDLMDKWPDWQRRVFELDWALSQDIPTDEPYTRPTLQSFIERELSGPRFYPEGWLFALDGDELVGMTNLWKNQARPDHLSTGMTGTRHDYRRQGIAVALKVKAAEFARQAGYAVIETDNAIINPMYQINLQLGFQPLPGWWFFRKDIHQEES